MHILLIVAVIVAVIAALFALDRLALWAESRGWIYYRRKRGSGMTAVGNALDVFHGMFETDVEQARLEIKEDKEAKKEIDAPPFGEEPDKEIDDPEK